ncbi:hypothetical protein A2961_02005 [Candidatus Woesebacteria bacterium RIFCSPLOWO2_01_FULL_39_21]|uniref:Uncharacterized protein n=1 Tax=Candidatus Woesebacteria bacterium RIFCSPLOWO2_01_FULL_39_21 TaxID=1802519 RepID=A0A1F8BGX7_9BACT|nr:MAG: hypothetical protein A2691_04365 [Candidatus Woesebacteria bacterium RIFCSPHIGHO2_01_FULL_39_23]OGM63301.1 MAG: hypothetical protein A2961_02005 [Candidatus Woesebacteria bacterium RIFCSPLOWO2_01_FULL_39_21]
MATPEIKETPQVDSTQREVTPKVESGEAPAEQPTVAEQPSQGAQPQPTQPQPVADDTSAQVADDTQVFAIPQDEKTLEEEAKGPIDKPLTWFANFWLRMIKKAIHFGKRIVVGITKK